MMVPLIRRTPRITAKSEEYQIVKCVLLLFSGRRRRGPFLGTFVGKSSSLGSKEFLHHEEVWACWSSLDAVGPGVGGWGFSLRSLSAPSSSLADSTSAF